MCVIYMMIDTFYDGLGIAVPVLIIKVFHMIKISYPCCFHIEDYATSLFTVGSAYTIMYYPFLFFRRYGLMNLY